MISRSKTWAFVLSTLVFVLAAAFSLPAVAETLVVGKSGSQFSSIQAAIDAAEPGDTVLVEEGAYEENLLVDKDLALKGVGASKVKIDGQKEGYPVLHIGPSEVEVTVKDLTLQGAEGDSCKKYEKGLCPDGVVAVGDSELRIEKVVISGNEGNGIGHYGSARVTVENSRISENEGNGIGLYNSARVTVDKTEITGNKWAAVMLGGSTQATVENIKVSGNGGGIWLSDSVRATVRNSKIEKSGGGFTLWGSAQATIENNKISGNKGTGILLSDSSRATVDNNEIKDNELGITLANSSRATTKENEIRDNKFGIGIEDSAQLTVQNNSIRENGTGIKIYEPEKFKGSLEGSNNRIVDNGADFIEVPKSTQEELVS